MPVSTTNPHATARLRATAVGCVLLLASLWMPAAGESKPPQHVRDLQGQPANPFSDTNSLATVLIFTSVDCPISNKSAPEIERLAQKHTKIKFWLVYPDATTSPEAALAHQKDYQLSSPGLLDPKHELVRIAGVKVTPEAAVFHQGKLVYRGRIDDRFPALGVARSEATTHDLEQILDALAAGQSLSLKTTRAIGCAIDPQSRE